VTLRTLRRKLNMKRAPARDSTRFHFSIWVKPGQVGVVPFSRPYPLSREPGDRRDVHFYPRTPWSALDSRVGSYDSRIAWEIGDTPAIISSEARNPGLISPCLARWKRRSSFLRIFVVPSLPPAAFVAARRRRFRAAAGMSPRVATARGRFYFACPRFQSRP